MKVEYVTHSGSDILTVNAARVSFAKESKELNDKDVKLINYLATEKHWLPFRHPQITLRCKAPMFVKNQLVKHQVGFSWSEESRRYIKGEVELYWPETWRKAAKDVKQGSSDEVFNLDDSFSHLPWQQELKYDVSTIVNWYEYLIDKGLAPEQARMILPQNMYVNWVWTGSLLGFAQMIKARTHESAQRETQEFARLVEEVIAPLYPVSYKALKENL